MCKLVRRFLRNEKGANAIEYGLIAAGIAVGCKTIFIDLEYVSEPKPESFSYSARSIAEAAEIILRDSA